jgi:hypothetical protein
VKVLNYPGVKVYTDTQFNRIPYWVDKENLSKTVITHYKCSYNDLMGITHNEGSDK